MKEVVILKIYHFAISTIDLGLPTIAADSSKVAAAIRFALTLTGGLAVLFVAIGGFRYATSGGDPNTLKQAKSTIIYSIVGLLLAIFAQIIIGLVVSAV